MSAGFFFSFLFQSQTHDNLKSQKLFCNPIDIVSSIGHSQFILVNMNQRVDAHHGTSDAGGIIRTPLSGNPRRRVPKDAPHLLVFKKLGEEHLPRLPLLPRAGFRDRVAAGVP